MPNRQSPINIVQVADRLAGYDSVEFAVLFGSFAGGAQPWSDVHIAVYFSRLLSLVACRRNTGSLRSSIYNHCRIWPRNGGKMGIGDSTSQRQRVANIATHPL